MINSDYGTLGRAVAGSATIRQRLDHLTAQAASGHVSDSYGGYTASAAQTMFELAPQVAQATVTSDALDAAGTRATVGQTAMTRLQSIASSFAASAISLGTTGGQAIDVIAAQARLALTQVASLLDTQQGSVYVFGGTDSATPPIPGAANILGSPFYLSIQASVQALAGNGSAATLAATLASSLPTSAVTPFAADQRPFVATAPSIGTAQGSVVTGLLAGQNTLTPASTGPSTTGSYMRDLMRSLATLGSLSSAQEQDPGFAAIVDDTRVSLQGAVTAMAADASALGASQAQMASEKTQVNDTSTVLQRQLGNVRDVDLAATLSELQQVQSQLTASYHIISDLKTMTLANYI